MREGKPPVLTAKDVGRILGEERRDGRTGALASKSVSQYLVESKKGGRFATHPFPQPAGRVGQWPYWLPDQEAEIREWARNRPGPGARTDLTRKKK
jgi:hypothetical protein